MAAKAASGWELQQLGNTNVVTAGHREGRERFFATRWRPSLLPAANSRYVCVLIRTMRVAPVSTHAFPQVRGAPNFAFKAGLPLKRKRIALSMQAAACGPVDEELFAQIASRLLVLGGFRLVFDAA